MQILLIPKTVTTSDTDLNNAVLVDGTNPEFIYVGTSGDVAFQWANKTTTVMPNVAAGGFLWVPHFTGVLTTGTTAANIFVTRRR